MKLPDFVYAKSFWEAVSLVVGGALALLAFFGYVDASWAVPTTVILAWLLGLLRMFGINPELRALLMERQITALEEQNRFLSKQVVLQKTVKKVNK